MFAADERHNIPIENFHLASSNYRQIFQDLADILLVRNFSPVYVMASEYNEVVSQLSWIQQKAGIPHFKGINQVAVLEDMFLELVLLV